MKYSYKGTDYRSMPSDNKAVILGLSVVPLATLARRKTVDVKVEYLPEEVVRTPSPKNTLKFSRQVSLPSSQIANRFFRQRMNSMPGDSPASKKSGEQFVLYGTLVVLLLLYESRIVQYHRKKNFDRYSLVITNHLVITTYDISLLRNINIIW